MKLTIISPEKIIFEGETTKVLVPGTKGSFEILRGHAPLISSLQKGVIRFDNNGTQQIKVSRGFVEIANDCIVACIEKEI